MSAPVTLQFHGRPPDSDAHVAPKSYADAQYAAQAVTPAIVNAKIATAAATLTDKSYVDSRDALRAHRADVTAADLNYVNATELGVTVAKLDAAGFLPAATIPANLVTDRVARCFSLISPAGVLGGTPNTVTDAVGSVQLTGTHTVITTVQREYQIATIPVPDLGYPYRPLPFAWVAGKAGGTVPPSRFQGNSNYGLLSVMAPPEVSNTVYAAGLCTASPYLDTYSVVPFAGPAQTPLTVPAVNTAMEYRLYGSCWSGANYVFSPVNLVYFILCIPAL